MLEYQKHNWQETNKQYAKTLYTLSTLYQYAKILEA